MGALTSRQAAGVEEVDIVSNHAYKYPPKSGNYFGSHFIMGGERFDTPQPEAYLFGENADLNFLGSRPTPFPYPPPQANEPTKTLKSLVNIRKESLRLVKTLPVGGGGGTGGGKTETDLSKPLQYTIEFIFDCDARTSITIYFFATEEMGVNGLSYTSKEPSLTSETFHFKRGANQLFSKPSVIFDPSKFSEEELLYNPEKEVLPIAIHCVAQDGPEDSKQSHTCISVVERHSDGTYVLKALKQKLYVDGLCYLLQEIYGIENKNIENIKGASDVETEDNGAECVICMCDVRDTLILPCRHLCLCNSCADSLRYQANNCPICRAPFRALLQIRALQKSASSHPLSVSPPSAALPHDGSCEIIPPGYEGVSLIEALNGPTTIRSSLERTPKSSKMVGSPDYERDLPTPEVRMSVLLAKEAGSPKEKRKSPVVSGGRWREKSRLNKDSVRTVSETSNNQDENGEDEVDSEAEKMSPLLSGQEEGPGSGCGERKESSQDDGSLQDCPLDEPPASASPTQDAGEVTTCIERSKTPSRGSCESIAREVTGGAGSGKSSPKLIRSGTVLDGGPLVEEIELRSCSGGQVLQQPQLGTGGIEDSSDYYTPEEPPTSLLSPLHSAAATVPPADKRQKWRKSGPNLSVGDVILMKDLNTPPYAWPLAIVEEIHPGRDDVVEMYKTPDGLPRVTV